MLRNPLPRGSIPDLCFRKGMTRALRPVPDRWVDANGVKIETSHCETFSASSVTDSGSVNECIAHCPQNMPEDFVLRNINGHDLWVSEGEKDSVEIKEHSHVRIRIANIQLQAEKLVRACHC